MKRWLRWTLGILAFNTWLAFMGAVAGGAIWPGTQRLAAPIVCPERTAPPVVVTATTSSSPGRTTFTGQLICFNARGEPERPGPMQPLVVLFVIYWVAGLLVTAAIGVLMVARQNSDAPRARR
jgi:hypothetical protein